MLEGLEGESLIVELYVVLPPTFLFPPYIFRGNSIHPRPDRFYADNTCVHFQLKLPPRSQRFRMVFWKVGLIRAIVAPC